MFLHRYLLPLITNDVYREYERHGGERFEDETGYLQATNHITEAFRGQEAYITYLVVAKHPNSDHYQVQQAGFSLSSRPAMMSGASKGDFPTSLNFGPFRVTVDFERLRRIIQTISVWKLFQSHHLQDGFEMQSLPPGFGFLRTSSKQRLVILLPQHIVALMSFQFATSLLLDRGLREGIRGSIANEDGVVFCKSVRFSDLQEEIFSFKAFGCITVVLW